MQKGLRPSKLARHAERMSEHWVAFVLTIDLADLYCKLRLREIGQRHKQADCLANSLGSNEAQNLNGKAFFIDEVFFKCFTILLR